MENSFNGARAVAAGDAHACALGGTFIDGGPAGGVSCWGANSMGQVGDGQTNGTTNLPRPTNIGDAVAIAAHGNNTCAVRANGDVQCWGDDSNGQLGVPSVLSGGGLSSNVPVTVVGLPGPAIAVAPGQAHACAALADGRVACWGYGGAGQLGTPATSSLSAALANW